MSIFRSRKIMAATVAGLALTGAVGAGIATSQDDSRASSFFDSVAKHLGISSEKLEEATRAAAIDQVDAALEDGRITEEQAEELKSRIESGEAPPFFGPGFFGEPRDGGHEFGFGFGDAVSTAAEYLGVTEDELREALQNGRSLADVAEAEDKSVEGLEQALVGQATTKLDDIVNSTGQERRGHREDFGGPRGLAPQDDVSPGDAAA